MNQHSAPVLGVIARGGPDPSGDASMVTVIEPGSPTWANDLFRRTGVTGDAIVFVPELERNPRIKEGTQLDELLPEQSPHVAVVTLRTHVTGIQAAVRDCAPRLGHRAEFIAAVRAHVAGSYAGVWLKRVGRLETPSPSFGQHLASWVPFAGGFFAGLHPTLGVRRRPEPAPSGGPATRVLRTSGPPDRRVEEALVKAYGAARPEVLGAAHRVAARWGLRRALEYVVSPDPSTVQLPPPDGSCPTCGDPIWGHCAFCHLTSPRLEHWSTVTVPGTKPAVDFEPEPVPAPPAAPAATPLPKLAFQLPRHRATTATPAGPPAVDDNPWVDRDQ